MSKNRSRSGLLTFFIIANLMFWILVAVAVGVVASDLVDLGIESFFRQSGTALVLRNSAPTRAASGGESPAPQAQPTALAAAVEPIEQTEKGAEAVDPAEAKSGAAASPKMTPYAPRTPGAQPTRPEPAAPALPTLMPTQAPRDAGSSLSLPALEAGPLLLVDPDVDRLTRLDAEIQQSAVGRSVEIRMDEDALNEQIAVALARHGELPYQQITADLRPGQITLSGNVSVLGLALPTQVQGTVLAVDCHPSVQIDSVAVGGILTPKFVKQQVVQLVEESLAWYPADYALCLEQIVIEENQATLYGSRR